MSAWSKLQKALYNVVTDKVDFQIHCSVYRMASERGSINLPRYWITIGGVIIFDYPKQFMDKACTKDYPYDTQISDISNCIREYVDCPIDLLPNKIFDNDKWGITDIFKAVDRRLGRERLKAYFSSPNPTIKIILDKRFGDKGECHTKKNVRTQMDAKDFIGRKVIKATGEEYLVIECVKVDDDYFIVLNDGEKGYNLKVVNEKKEFTFWDKSFQKKIDEYVK